MVDKAKKVKEIEDLTGVGESIAEKLRESGYSDIMSLAVASPRDVADATDIGENIAAKIIMSARKAADIGWEVLLTPSFPDTNAILLYSFHLLMMSSLSIQKIRSGPKELCKWLNT